MRADGLQLGTLTRSPIEQIMADRPPNRLDIEVAVEMRRQNPARDRRDILRPAAESIIDHLVPLISKSKLFALPASMTRYCLLSLPHSAGM